MYAGFTLKYSQHNLDQGSWLDLLQVDPDGPTEARKKYLKGLWESLNIR